MSSKSKIILTSILLTSSIFAQTALANTSPTLRTSAPSFQAPTSNTYTVIAQRDTTPASTQVQTPEAVAEPEEKPFILKDDVQTLPLIDGLSRLKIVQLSKNKGSIVKGMSMRKAERKAIVQALKTNDYKLFWFSDNQLNTTKVNALLATLKNAKSFALNSARYKLEALEELIEAASTELSPEWLDIPQTPENLKKLKNNKPLNQVVTNRVKLDLALTQTALLYTRHASAGQLLPSKIDRNYDLNPKATPANLVLESIKTLDGELQAWLELQSPQSSQFKTLLAEFHQLSAETKEIVTPINVPAGKTLRPGVKSSRVAKLAARLEQLGFYTILESDGDSEIYNDDLVTAVKNYQEAKNLKPDGLPGRKTLAALNYTVKSPLKVLLVNLERQRWLPEDMGEKYIFVNQPEFMVRIFEKEKEKEKVIFSSIVIVGQAKYQTPVFNDVMRNVVVNPYWNIPNSIIMRMIKPKAMADPGFLARNDYEVIGKLDWSKASRRSMPFRIRQKPGRKNALGQIKFMFPNRHAIYLHDTPTKSLFNNASRAFSAGCVRVKKPKEFAQQLMGWSSQKYDSLMNARKNKWFKMERKLPIYLTYMTALVDEAGTVQYYNDVYSRDNAIAKALNTKDFIQSSQTIASK